VIPATAFQLTTEQQFELIKVRDSARIQTHEELQMAVISMASQLLVQKNLITHLMKQELGILK
jgi:hypothetical protein